MFVLDFFSWLFSPRREDTEPDFDAQLEEEMLDDEEDDEDDEAPGGP
jgi:hypothetical protein